VQPKDKFYLKLIAFGKINYFGINQVILLALSMVVIASMVGAKGLGSIVYQGIQRTTLQKVLNLLGIVILAIILDRTTQAIAKKIITGRLIIRILINKYNYVEIEKVRNVT
jgi:ABC-type proline/glycine betaine transport system permease subunit